MPAFSAQWRGRMLSRMGRPQAGWVGCSQPAVRRHPHSALQMPVMTTLVKPQPHGHEADVAATSLARAAPELSAAGVFQAACGLFSAGRTAQAEACARQGLARWLGDHDLNNLLGVVLKQQGHYAQALQALERAALADPTSHAPLINRGGVLLAMGDGARAVPVYRQLIQLRPADAEMCRLLGVAHQLSGEMDLAIQHFEQACALAPADDRAWADLVAVQRRGERHDDALQTLARAVAAAGSTQRLVTVQAATLAAAGRHAEALAGLEAVLAKDPSAAWAHYHLGLIHDGFNRPAANRHLLRAAQLDPKNRDALVALARSLDRTRGPQEAACIQAAHAVARQVMALGGDLLPHSRVLAGILERCADHEGVADLIDFDRNGHHWARTGQPWALHHHLGRVRHAQDRRSLVEMHRCWGRGVEAVAERTPLRRAAPRTARGARRERIRVGVMSSDLRAHPVSYFALPLLEGHDRSRFEFFCYSWSNKPVDAVQKHIAGQVAVFRHHPQISHRDAAQLIADDQPDILFELGGTTDMNKLEVMAWRPAPVQVSWLGYPHSAGLASIDRILVDPWLKPADPALLAEQPFELAHSWVTLGRLGFGDGVAIEPGLPQDRHGPLTFGTMNNPAKYRPETLAAWAEVLRRTPGSRFLFVRPEGGATVFRQNIRRAFEACGVSGDRVDFIAVRGTHLQHYNAIDIALDTFPQTGGTTTCESLWMGVPVVTLVGEAFFERLSYSNLMNAGLAELCAFDVEAYIALAVALASDAPKRRALRTGMRERLRTQPLGRNELFVDDFQRAIESAVSRTGTHTGTHTGTRTGTRTGPRTGSRTAPRAGAAPAKRRRA